MRIRLLSLLLLVIQFGCISQSTKIESKFELGFESESAVDSISKSNDGVISQQEFYVGKSSLSFKSKKEKLIVPFQLQAKKIYKVSFWKKGEVKLFVVLEDKEKVKLKENLSYKSDKKWDKIELLVNTAWVDSTVNSKVIIENDSKEPCYVDHLVIEELKGGGADYSFKIKKKQAKKLIGYRNKAAYSPFIKTKFKKKVKAKLNGEPVKFKLKGDWTDHVWSGIWSFKTYGETEITKDLKTLTFQNAKTRNLLKEWTFIQLCNSAGIVTPTYEFVNVSINKGTPYVCALEEDFSNDFIKRKRGYSAPVLRLYEDFLFPHWVYGWGHEKVTIPEINHSFIYCFEDSKYSSGKYKKQFDSDAAKLKEFIKGDSIIHLIDIEKWSEFLAIQALTKSYHNLTWHNTRWFVNDKGLIEPVAYDGNTQDGEAEHWFGGVYGDLNRYLKNGASVAVNFNNKLFMSPLFMKSYKKKLELYSNEEFVWEKLKAIESEMESSLSKLQKYYDYDYTTDYLFASAKQLRKVLPKIDNTSWVGKEHVFNVDFKTGTAPLNEVYASNLIRGYYAAKNVAIVNGTAHQINVYTKGNKKQHTIEANSEVKIEYIRNEKWFVKVKGDEIEIPILPWMPLN